MKRYHSFYLLLAVCLFWMATDKAEALELEVGQAFPNMLLPSLEGPPSSIADFRGDKLIVHIWASW